jgi:hypothetical protein
MIITPTSLTVTQLLGSTNEQYVVPAYQRRYSWKDKQLWELVDDIELLDGTDTHLLGSIVCLTGQHVAGMNRLELVDGQQRLTTISILLQCILDRLSNDGESSEAQDIARLLTAKALGGSPQRKIALDSLDCTEFDQFVNGASIETPQNHCLSYAFAFFRKWVKDQELPNLATFLYRLKNQAIVIRLDVSEAKDAFKLFETINNRGLRLSPTDIIKNFLLGNAARLNLAALTLARASWANLITNLDGVNFDAFFRHFLCARLKKRITASFVIPSFKKLFMEQVSEAAALPDRHWYTDVYESEEENGDISEETEIENDVLDPEQANEVGRIPFSEFMEALVTCAKVYGQLVRCDTGNPKIDRHLQNLRMIKAMQAYGFLMHLRSGLCSDADFVKVLRLTENFLLRRHVCRERSNENETAFARLCGVDCTVPLSNVKEVYREYSPSDEKFKDEFAATSYNAGLIDRARYCLEQFELSRHGHYLELLVGGPDLVHVEHIIPQKIKTKKAKDELGDWPTYLGAHSETQHSKHVSRIGNMTLFSGTLNIGASNNPYKRKCKAYRDSAIKITNSLPTEFPHFRFPQVDKRSKTLAEEAVLLWPLP